MRYNITCQSCGSTYTADRIDNCKQCGSPVAICDIKSEPVAPEVHYHINESSPIVIERLDDYFAPDITRFRAWKWLDGRKIMVEMMVSDFMLMNRDFDVREHIERRLKHQIAEFIVNDAGSVCVGADWAKGPYRSTRIEVKDEAPYYS